jgi:hypothetical protein
MCNLYSVTKGQQAIRELAGAMSDRTGNLPLLPGIYPDYRTPVVCNRPEGRELIMVRWGMPSPVAALKRRNADPGVTNIRNVRLNPRTGAAGSGSNTAAWCRSQASARTKRCLMEVSHRCGSRSMRHGL